MTITYIKGNMFDDQSEAIVNTVNCVGVMGKGVAKEFKNRWPENYKEYKKLCDDKKLRPGIMFTHDQGGIFSSNHRYLINFPTKDHWRSKSKMEYITDGLDAFAAEIKRLNIKSVSIPPLGCGNGGLPWDDVRVQIESKLSGIDGVEFRVFAPKEHRAPEHEKKPQNMTFSRAMLVKSIDQFEDYFGGSLTRICVQKLVYFLQVLGVAYPFKFERNHHGPYSEGLKSALHAMNQQNYIEGYDQDEPDITACAGAVPMAEEELQNPKHKNSESILKRLSLLIDGYENPYGMELLASVHYLHDHENVKTTEAIIKAVKSWNDHKNTVFTQRDIIAAYDRLKEDKFIH